MEFEYTGTFWVEPCDLDEMVELCQKYKVSPQEALNSVACGWDDCDFYSVGLVEDQIIAEIERRLAE